MYLCFLSFAFPILPFPFSLLPFAFSLLPYIIARKYLRAYKAPLHLSFSLYICRERTTNQTFYAKQSQIYKKSNERK